MLLLFMMYCPKLNNYKISELTKYGKVNGFIISDNDLVKMYNRKVQEENYNIKKTLTNIYNRRNGDINRMCHQCSNYRNQLI